MKFIKVVMALLCLQMVSSSFQLKSNLVHQQSDQNFHEKVILFENDQLKIESNFSEYKDPSRSVIKNYLLLSFINKTNKKLTVNFSREAYYDGKCSSCGLDEAKFSIQLDKKETLTGTGQPGSENALRAFHSFKTGESKRQLTDFRITNVSIKKA